MRNYFTFGDYDSRDFGVFITRDGVYNAPRRVYRQIQVPGRNGDLMFDEGRFENIDVTYPCLIYAGFNANIEGLRNALLSQKGYVRITDSYHPDEYRLGCYSEEFSVVPKVLGDGGTFEITFNCKPQRFLKSGEESITYPPGGANSPNLIPYPYCQTTRTVSGVTFTDNGDGTITVNGTNTGSSTAEFVMTATAQNIVIPAGSYFISGCTGGSSTTYLIQWNPTGGTTVNNYDGSRAVDLSTDTVMRVSIKVISGATVNNVTFKPMLRLASDTDSKWYPYWDGTKQIYNPTLFASKPLIRVTFDEVAELIEPPYYYEFPYNLAGVTFSDGGDGYIEINGTTTTGFSFLCKNRMPAPPEGTYHLSGCPEGGSSSSYSQYVVLLNNNTSIKTVYDYGDGADLEISSVQTGSSYTLSVYIRAESAGMTFEHFRIKPSLVPVSAANCRVYVGENLITLKNDYPYIDVDSEIQDCYYGNVNANSNVILQNNDFPVLEPGVTGITLGAGIESIEVTPRWFRL